MFSVTCEQVFCLLFGGGHITGPTLQSVEAVVSLDYGKVSCKTSNSNIMCGMKTKTIPIVELECLGVIQKEKTEYTFGKIP